MFVNFFGCKVTPTMLQTFCYRVTIRLQRPGRPLFFFMPHPAWSRIVTCYMLHVTLRPPPLPSPPPREALTSRVSVLLRYTSHGRMESHCYMLHVTLRPPHFLLRLLAKRCTCCLVVSLLTFVFYSLAREKSNCSPPPSRLLTRMLPRWRMTAFLTMASPRPVPPSDRLRPLSTR